MLLNLHQQFLFFAVLIENRLFGGAEKAHIDFNIYNRGTSDDATKKKAKKGHNLHRQNTRWWKIILEGVPPPTIVNLFPSTIFYDDKKHNKKKSLDIDGTKVPFRLNYVTTKTKRAKPKAQLSSIQLGQFRAPRITPQSHGPVTKVVFSDTSHVHVIYANEHSNCAILRDIANKAFGEPGIQCEEALNALPRNAWEMDRHAGGRYAPLGIGSMDTRQRKPFTLKNHQFNASKKITGFLATMLSSVATAIMHYAPEVFKMNEQLKCDNEAFSYPPIKQQGYLSWFANQVAIRRLGKGAQHFTPRVGADENLDIVGLHFDGGDLSTSHPLVYIPRGGKHGRGGKVDDTELLVAESRVGGNYVVIETNVPGHVCIVVLNSAEMLHGLIAGNGEGDSDAYTTRIIPFITDHINNFMTKNKGELPIDTHNAFK